MKILIVDDSGLSRKMLLRKIPESIKESSEIYQGKNGQEGLDLYKENKPDIVFLDLTMPVMDGFEALYEIISYDKKAFVIVVSADIQAKAKERVLSLGARYMEHKPITSERLGYIFQSLNWNKI